MNIDLSNEDRSVIIEALEALLSFIVNLPASPELPKEARRENAKAINTAISKLTLDDMSPRLYPEELKVVYWALTDFKDSLSAKRNGQNNLFAGKIAVEKLNKTRSLIRTFKEALQASPDGRSILDLFR